MLNGYQRVEIVNAVTGAVRSTYAKIVGRTADHLIIRPENTGIRTHIPLDRVLNIATLITR